MVFPPKRNRLQARPASSSLWDIVILLIQFFHGVRMGRSSMRLASSSPTNNSRAGSQRSFRFNLIAICCKLHKMSDAHRNFDRRRRLGPAFDRVDEVDVVVVALEEMDFAGGGLRRQQRLGMGVHARAVHVDPSLGAEEHHAVAVASLLQGMLLRGAVVHVDQRHAVGVAILDLPACGAVGEHVLGENARAFDFRRPAQFGAVSPLGDVEVMHAPVADHAQAIVRDAVPDAVSSPSLPLRPRPATLVAVRRHGRRAEPQLVVQFLGHRFGGLLGAGPTAGHADQDRLQLADLPVAHQLARTPELAVGALLGAELEHDAAFLDGLAQGLRGADAPADGLFAVHVLAPPDRFQRDERVPVVGRRDLHGVDVLALHEFPEVLVGSAVLVVVELVHRLLGLVPLGFMHVAHGHGPGRPGFRGRSACCPCLECPVRCTPAPRGSTAPPCPPCPRLTKARSREAPGRRPGQRIAPGIAGG